jgi:hypothetical protein
MRLLGKARLGEQKILCRTCAKEEEKGQAVREEKKKPRAEARG